MYIPKHPKNSEKHLYAYHGQRLLTACSLVSFIGVTYSSFKFFSADPRLYILFPLFGLTFFWYLISVIVQGFGKSFNLRVHREIISAWKPKKFPTVDIFLPVCGENLKILKNTWKGVKILRESYQGKVKVFVLDDFDDAETKRLAKQFNFIYLVRPDRGYYKKAGNLRFGFGKSSSEVIAIFDADFRPGPDFLNELLPYFDAEPKLGIVQSPQYFDVGKSQNWIERGAGSVQEYFYRSVQQNRQSQNGAICVGSNAIYRRQALLSNGGTTLIEHSEDVHTGFDLRRQGWGLLYIPVILAKGVCPSDIKSFFRQQYRWCKGSMSLLGSGKFWKTKMPLRSRLCYMTGFLYYIHTAIFTIVGSLIPLALLFIVPELARLGNYLLLIPSIIYNFFIFPLWHKTEYKSEALSIRVIYGWAHLFAILDSLIGRGMEWHPTGSAHKRSTHFAVFKSLLLTYSLVTGFLWVGGSLWYMFTWNIWNFAPVFVSGVIYLLIVTRIVFSSFISTYQARF